MNPEEALAKVCFDSLCAPRSLLYNDVQSNREPDFQVLDERDRRVGVLEVTRAMHERYTRTFEAVLDKRHGYGRVDALLCANGWRVIPSADANINTVRAHLDEYLARIEREGLREFNDATCSDAVCAIVRDLRVETGVVGEPGFECHHINPPSMTVTGDPDAVNEAVRVEAAKPDNVTKLSQPGDAERHLFVCVEASSLAAYHAMQQEYEPDPVALNPAITHVWVACRTHSLSAQVWHAVNAGRWHQRVVSWRVPFD